MIMIMIEELEEEVKELEARFALLTEKVNLSAEQRAERKDLDRRLLMNRLALKRAEMEREAVEAAAVENVVLAEISEAVEFEKLESLEAERAALADDLAEEVDGVHGVEAEVTG